MEASDDTAVVDVLRTLRRITGMEAAYLAEFAAGEQVLRCTDAEDGPGSFPFPVGTRHRLEEAYCQRVVDHRLPRVVPDARAEPEIAELELTEQAGIRGYIGVPVRLPDGRLYGSVCCIDHEAQPGLSERDADLLQGLATLLGHHLHDGREAERVVRERDELLASVSHDLRTPLMAMRFLGEDLEHGVADPQRAGADIAREADRVLGMVEDLMMVTRHRAGTAFLQDQRVDLAALVDEAAGGVARGEHRAQAGRLQVVRPDGPLEAQVDPNRVLRALRNLLDNAFKYAREGAVTLELVREGPTAVLSVADEGPGIRPADLPHVQERFFRAPQAVEAGVVGTGLGLTTVQAVADLHEGTLDVRSTPGEGTRVLLRLPLERPAGVEPAAAAGSAGR